MRHLLQVPFGQHFGHAEFVVAVAAKSGFVDEHMLCNELSVILVGGQHQYFEIAGFIGHFCQCADYIVGFVAFYLHHRNAVCFDYLFDNRHGSAYVFGCGLALCFVGFVGFVAKGLASRVEHHGDVCGLFAFQHIVECVYKSENGAGVQPFGVDARIFDKSIVGAINLRVGIDEQQSFHGWLCVMVSDVCKDTHFRAIVQMPFALA